MRNISKVCLKFHRRLPHLSGDSRGQSRRLTCCGIFILKQKNSLLGCFFDWRGLVGYACEQFDGELGELKTVALIISIITPSIIFGKL